MFEKADPTMDDNISWYINEFHKDGMKKRAYGELVKIIIKANPNSRKKYTVGLRQYIEKNNPDLLEWFDGIMIIT